MKLTDAALDLLLGGACHGCGTPGRSPCATCRTWLVPHPHDLTRVPVALVDPAVRLVAGLRYSPATSGFLVAYKDQEAWQLTATLAPALAAAAMRLLPPPGAVLVPVPSSPAAVKRRGFEHTVTLSRWVGSRYGLAVRRLLRRVGDTAHQVGQDARSRLVAQRGTMVAVPSSRREVVIVADDVVTTGATVAEAVRALLAGGHQVIGLAAVADTPPAVVDGR